MLPGLVRSTLRRILLRALGPEPERLTVTAVSFVSTTFPPKLTPSEVPKAFPSPVKTRPPAAEIVPA